MIGWINFKEIIAPQGVTMAKHWDRVADLYGTFTRLFGWAEKQLAIAQGISGRVLEVCCGTAHLTIELLKRGLDAYVTDLSPKMIARAKQKLVQENLDPSQVSVADVKVAFRRWRV